MTPLRNSTIYSTKESKLRTSWLFLCFPLMTLITVSAYGAKKNLSLSIKGRKTIDEVVISKRPSNLILWGIISRRPIKSKPYSHSTIDEHFGQIITALSAINEHERKYENDNGYLIKNLLHTYQDNFLYQFYRSSEIFIKSKDLETYMAEFEITNHIPVSDFIFICHAISIKYANELEKPIEMRNWILDSAAFSESTGFTKEKIDSTLKLISFTQSEAEKYAASSKFADHDFNFFSNRPFLSIGEERYIPTDAKLTQNLVFNNLFHRIKGSTKNKESFMRSFGFAFERYASELIRYACENSKSYKYTHIQEFEYGSPTKKSSDAYISLYDESIKATIILVFEFKSAKILDSARRLSESNYAIERSIGKLSTAPTEQQLKRTSEIIDGGFNSELTKESIYYFISVSMDDFPVLAGNWETQINLNHLSNIKCAGIYSFCIEELELLTKMISNNLDWPAHILLNEYSKKYPDLSFKTFLSRIGKKVKYENKPFEQKLISSQKIIIEHLKNKNK